MVCKEGFYFLLFNVLFCPWQKKKMWKVKYNVYEKLE